MDTGKGEFKISQQFLKIPVRRSIPAYQYIIKSRTRMSFGQQPHCFAQTPFDTVALHCITDFSGRCKTKARLCLTTPGPFFALPASLQNQTGRGPFTSLSQAQKICAALKRLHDYFRSTG